MFLGDVRGEAIGRHALPAEPAEGLAGRDVNALHSQQHEWRSVRTSSASESSSSCSRNAYSIRTRTDGSRVAVTRNLPPSPRHPLQSQALAVALTSGTRLGCYEIATQTGVGGVGEVYRATDTNIGRQVAIKILPAAFAQDLERLARFEREAKTRAA